VRAPEFSTKSGPFVDKMDGAEARSRYLRTFGDVKERIAFLLFHHVGWRSCLPGRVLQRSGFDPDTWMPDPNAFCNLR